MVLVIQILTLTNFNVCVIYRVRQLGRISYTTLVYSDKLSFVLYSWQGEVSYRPKIEDSFLIDTQLTFSVPKAHCFRVMTLEKSRGRDNGFFLCGSLLSVKLFKKNFLDLLGKTPVSISCATVVLGLCI